MANGRISGSTRPFLKVRDGGCVVSIAAIIAMGVNRDGRREILGLGLGPSEAATFWLGFLRGLEQRGLAGVKLVISDAHEGLKAAIRQVFKASWQRCRVHFMRNALAYVPKGQHSMVSAAIRTVFAQPTPDAASAAWRHVADQLRPRFPKLAALMDDAEADVLAYKTFPAAHWPKLHSTNPIERLNKEVKRRADVPRAGLRPPEGRLWHLPERSQHHQARRRHPHGAERRVAVAAPLPDPGDNHRPRRRSGRRLTQRSHKSCLTRRPEDRPQIHTTLTDVIQCGGSIPERLSVRYNDGRLLFAPSQRV